MNMYLISVWLTIVFLTVCTFYAEGSNALPSDRDVLRSPAVNHSNLRSRDSSKIANMKNKDRLALYSSISGDDLIDPEATHARSTFTRSYPSMLSSENDDISPEVESSEQPLDGSYATRSHKRINREVLNDSYRSVVDRSFQSETSPSLDNSHLETPAILELKPSLDSLKRLRPVEESLSFDGTEPLHFPKQAVSSSSVLDAPSTSVAVSDDIGLLAASDEATASGIYDVTIDEFGYDVSFISTGHYPTKHRARYANNEYVRATMDFTYLIQPFPKVVLTNYLVSLYYANTQYVFYQGQKASFRYNNTIIDEAIVHGVYATDDDSIYMIQVISSRYFDPVELIQFPETSLENYATNSIAFVVEDVETIPYKYSTHATSSYFLFSFYMAQSPSTYFAPTDPDLVFGLNLAHFVLVNTEVSHSLPNEPLSDPTPGEMASAIVVMEVDSASTDVIAIVRRSILAPVRFRGDVIDEGFTISCIFPGQIYNGGVGMDVRVNGIPLDFGVHYVGGHGTITTDEFSPYQVLVEIEFYDGVNIANYRSITGAKTGLAAITVEYGPMVLLGGNQNMQYHHLNFATRLRKFLSSATLSHSIGIDNRSPLIAVPPYENFAYFKLLPFDITGAPTYSGSVTDLNFEFQIRPTMFKTAKASHCFRYNIAPFVNNTATFDQWRQVSWPQAYPAGGAQSPITSVGQSVCSLHRLLYPGTNRYGAVDRVTIATTTDIRPSLASQSALEESAPAQACFFLNQFTETFRSNQRYLLTCSNAYILEHASWEEGLEESRGYFLYSPDIAGNPWVMPPINHVVGLQLPQVLPRPYGSYSGLPSLLGSHDAEVRLLQSDSQAEIQIQPLGVTDLKPGNTIAFLGVTMTSFVLSWSAATLSPDQCVAYLGVLVDPNEVPPQDDAETAKMGPWDGPRINFIPLPLAWLTIQDAFTTDSAVLTRTSFAITLPANAYTTTLEGYGQDSFYSARVVCSDLAFTRPPFLGVYRNFAAAVYNALADVPLSNAGLDLTGAVTLVRPIVSRPVLKAVWYMRGTSLGVTYSIPVSAPPCNMALSFLLAGGNAFDSLAGVGTLTTVMEGCEMGRYFANNFNHEFGELPRGYVFRGKNSTAFSNWLDQPNLISVNQGTAILERDDSAFTRLLFYTADPIRISRFGLNVLRPLVLRKTDRITSFQYSVDNAIPMGTSLLEDRVTTRISHPIANGNISADDFQYWPLRIFGATSRASVKEAPHLLADVYVSRMISDTSQFMLRIRYTAPLEKVYRHTMLHDYGSVSIPTSITSYDPDNAVECWYKNRLLETTLSSYGVLGSTLSFTYWFIPDLTDSETDIEVYCFNLVDTDFKEGQEEILETTFELSDASFLLRFNLQDTPFTRDGLERVEIAQTVAISRSFPNLDGVTELVLEFGQTNIDLQPGRTLFVKYPKNSAALVPNVSGTTSCAIEITPRISPEAAALGMTEENLAGLRVEVNVNFADESMLSLRFTTQNTIDGTLSFLPRTSSFTLRCSNFQNKFVASSSYPTPVDSRVTLQLITRYREKQYDSYYDLLAHSHPVLASPVSGYVAAHLAMGSTIAQTAPTWGRTVFGRLIETFPPETTFEVSLPRGWYVSPDEKDQVSLPYSTQCTLYVLSTPELLFSDKLPTLSPWIDPGEGVEDTSDPDSKMVLATRQLTMEVINPTAVFGTGRFQRVLFKLGAGEDQAVDIDALLQLSGDTKEISPRIPIEQGASIAIHCPKYFRTPMLSMEPQRAKFTITTPPTAPDNVPTVLVEENLLTPRVILDPTTVHSTIIEPPEIYSSFSYVRIDAANSSPSRRNAQTFTLEQLDKFYQVFIDTVAKSSYPHFVSFISPSLSFRKMKASSQPISPLVSDSLAKSLQSSIEKTVTSEKQSVFIANLARGFTPLAQKYPNHGADSFPWHSTSTVELLRDLDILWLLRGLRAPSAPRSAWNSFEWSEDALIDVISLDIAIQFPPSFVSIHSITDVLNEVKLILMQDQELRERAEAALEATIIRIYNSGDDVEDLRCFDGVTTQATAETGIDCGGPICSAKCQGGVACKSGSDCLSGYCDSITSKCSQVV